MSKAAGGRGFAAVWKRGHFAWEYKEIQWNASGDIFQLYLYDTSGGLLGVAANLMGPGIGASFQAPAGTFYLQVNAIGGWTIRIVQLGHAAADASGGIEFSGNGALNTRPFNVGGPWEVQWTASGDIFQVYLHTQSGNLAGCGRQSDGQWEWCLSPTAGTITCM